MSWILVIYVTINGALVPTITVDEGLRHWSDCVSLGSHLARELNTPASFECVPPKKWRP